MAAFNLNNLKFFKRIIELRKKRTGLSLDLIDTLTGVNSKNALEKDKVFLMKAMIVGEMQSQKKNNTETTSSLLYCDISNLKTVNDTYNHDVGDIGIKKVCHALKFCLREGDYIARIYDGDEFIIFLPNCPKEEAKIVKERIDGKIEEVLDDIRITYPAMANLSCAIGIADTSEIPMPKSLDDVSVSNSYEELKKLSEERMYADKKLAAKGRSEEQKDMKLLSSDQRDATFLGIDYNDDVAFEEMIARKRRVRQQYLEERDQVEKRK